MNGEFTNPRCKRLQLQPTRRMPVEPGRRERSDFGSSIMTGVKCSAGGEAIAAPDESRNGPMPVRTRTPRTIGAEEGPPRQGLSRPGESSPTRIANVCNFNPTDQENTGRAGHRERSDFGSSIMTGVKCSAGGEAIAAPDESPRADRHGGPQCAFRRGG